MHWHVELYTLRKVLWVLVKLDQGCYRGMGMLRAKHGNAAAITTSADDLSVYIPTPPCFNLICCMKERGLAG